MADNRGKLFQYPDLAQPTFTPAEDITLDKWYAPLSEPRFPRYFLLVLQPEVARQIPPVPEMAGWYVQHVQVPAPRSRIAAILASGLTFVGEPEVEEVTLDKWYLALSRPVPAKPGIHASRVPAFWVDPDALTQPEVTTADRWFRPLSEPVRQRRDRFAYLKAGVFDSTVIWPSGETVTLDKWFAPLSEPRRSKRPLPVGALPSFWIDPVALTLPESTTVDRWFQPFSEPVRARDNRAHLQAGLFDGTTVWPQAVSFDWFHEFSQPQFPRRQHVLGGEFAPIFIFIPPSEAEAMEWWVPFPEQILFRQRQAYLQAGSFDGTTVWPQRSRGLVTANDALLGKVSGGDSALSGAVVTEIHGDVSSSDN